MRWCLSSLQADRKHFDEKLWNGKNETKFDNQQRACSSSSIATIPSGPSCSSEPLPELEAENQKLQQQLKVALAKAYDQL